MIAMVDMGMGNLQSVCKAFEHIGAEVTVADCSRELTRAKAIILPGVGAFGDGMAHLYRKGLVETIQKEAHRGKPVFGICLGMQLLADEGEEYGLHQGLGLIKGRVARLNSTGNGCRVPNIGWCDVHVLNNQSILFENIACDSSFYFAHSYYMRCVDTADITATLEFDSSHPAAAVEHDNIFGVQFHPEKSQDVGLELLHTFWSYVKQQ
jgi:glutamine amidotransferase